MPPEELNAEEDELSHLTPMLEEVESAVPSLSPKARELLSFKLIALVNRTLPGYENNITEPTTSEVQAIIDNISAEFFPPVVFPEGSIGPADSPDNKLKEQLTVNYGEAEAERLMAHLVELQERFSLLFSLGGIVSSEGKVLFWLGEDSTNVQITCSWVGIENKMRRLREGKLGTRLSKYGIVRISRNNFQTLIPHISTPERFDLEEFSQADSYIIIASGFLSGLKKWDYEDQDMTAQAVFYHNTPLAYLEDQLPEQYLTPLRAYVASYFEEHEIPEQFSPDAALRFILAQIFPKPLEVEA